jgi:hypothetical protein
MECHNLKSNSELTLFALKLGLISVDPGPAKALAVSSKR